MEFITLHFSPVYGGLSRPGKVVSNAYTKCGKVTLYGVNLITDIELVKGTVKAALFLIIRARFKIK